MEKEDHNAADYAGNGHASLAHAFHCLKVRFIAGLKQLIKRYCKMTNIALCYIAL